MKNRATLYAPPFRANKKHKWNTAGGLQPRGWSDELRSIVFDVSILYLSVFVYV